MSKASNFPAALSLEGETALITGGGSGLGLEIARCFVDAGARVTLVGRTEARLSGAAEELGSKASYEVCDITQLEDLPNLVERVWSRHGRISILINNAGNHLKKAAIDTTPEEFAAILGTHVNAAFAVSQLTARRMMEEGRGSIVFIASMASLFGIPLVAAYSAAKSAQLGLVRSLASELSPEGIRVNAIAPGWIETSMMRAALNNDAARSAKVLSRTPMGRFGSGTDVGWAAVYLCSPAASFITGVVLPVDGGASIGF